MPKNLLFAAALVLLGATVAHGGLLNSDDLVVSAQSCPSSGRMCQTSISSWTPDGEAIDRLSLVRPRQNFFTELAFDVSGKLLFLDDVRLRVLSESLEEEGFIGGKRDLVQSISFDSNGNAWIGVFNFGKSNINQYNSRGELVARIKTRYPVYASDLAADQCTFFYTSDARGDQVIRRYNLCSQAAMDDFATVEALKVTQLRVLPDGGVIVSTSREIVRFDAEGAKVATYNVSVSQGWRSLALTADGSDVWGLTRNMLVRFDLQKRNTEAILFLPDEIATGIAVRNGWRAGLSSGRPAAPTNLRVVIPREGEFRLTWDDNATDETGYSIEYRVNFGKWRLLGTTPANSTQVSVTDWAWARSYSFRVQAKNAAGVSGYSNEAGTWGAGYD